MLMSIIIFTNLQFPFVKIVLSISQNRTYHFYILTCLLSKHTYFFSGEIMLFIN